MSNKYNIGTDSLNTTYNSLLQNLPDLQTILKLFIFVLNAIF